MAITNLAAACAHIAELVLRSKRTVVFTGAGVSTESGIPDFRGPNGLWRHQNPDDYTFRKYLTDPERRRAAWERFLNNRWHEAEPNAAHLAIAELERMSRLDCVITQNIDGLHHKAGNSPERVIELHGTSREVGCLECGKRWPRQEIEVMLRSGVEDPHCDECGGLLKSATISFGQPMPIHATLEAERRSRQCDVFLVVGSSLVVYPAAYMPVYALESAAKVAIVNLEETPLDGQVDVVVHAKAGDAMSKILVFVQAGLAAQEVCPTATPAVGAQHAAPLRNERVNASQMKLQARNQRRRQKGRNGAHHQECPYRRRSPIRPPGPNGD